MTLKEALESLTPPYNEQAIANTPVNRHLDPVNTISQAVSKAFIWKDSPEGQKYWNEKYKTLEKMGL